MKELIGRRSYCRTEVTSDCKTRRDLGEGVRRIRLRIIIQILAAPFEHPSKDLGRIGACASTLGLRKHHARARRSHLVDTVRYVLRD